MNIKVKYPETWDKYTLFALCSIAFCVSLGAATVSISKFFLLVGFLVQIIIDRKKLFQDKATKIPIVFIWMFAAVVWSLISMTWSDAAVQTQRKYFYSHTRFLWLGVIYYLLMTKDRALISLKWLIYGQIFIVAISWLMWFGLEVPFTRRPLESGIAFTSTLEQPVMTVLVLIVLWGFRDYWTKLWGGWFLHLIIVVMLLNIIFVMSGRTGYIVLLISIAIEAYRLLKGRWRLLAFLSPIILSLAFFAISPIFSKRLMEISINTQSYFEKQVLSSEGERFEMWRSSIYGIIKKPILGYGIGSMPEVYKENGGKIKASVSQPHQQYLFWWVEFGFIGLMIMLAFFFALIKDSYTIDNESRKTLHSTMAVLFVMGLFNCPFFGVGMGEFFFLVIAAILRIRGVMKLPLTPRPTKVAVLL
jgi:O-antigen ligase